MSLPKAIQDMADYAKSVEAVPQEEQPVESPVEEQIPEPQQRLESPEKPTPSPVGEPSDVWEQRYKSYKGHADAELRRMQQAVQQAVSKSEQLEQQLRELSAKFESKAEQDAYPQVTDEEAELVGRDVISTQEKIARRVMLDAQKVWGAERQALLSRIDELQNSIGSMSEDVSKSDKQRFFDQLSMAVPDWEIINQDVGFHSWLTQEDQFSGLQRQQLLTMAGDRNDVVRVKAIFNAYKATLTATTPEKTNASQQELEKQVSPSKQRGNVVATDSSSSKKIWTQQELQQFYHNVAHGKVTPEQAQKIEIEIHKAVTEGRVR